MPKTLAYIALWMMLAMAVGYWTTPTAGWVLLTAGLSLMVLASGRQLTQIRKWVTDFSASPPASVGPWDEIIAPIYREIRRNSAHIKELDQHIDNIMLAAEALPDGAITLDADMMVTWCNKTACAHTGLDLQKDRNYSIFNILRSPEFNKYARQSTWPEPMLLHHTAHDHVERALQLQLTRYGADQYLVVTRDVTQVEKLETTRKDFVANVSHELRTPLTVLSGFLETLHDIPREEISDEQRKHYLDLMMQQASRMQAIVADLLTLSTLESSPTQAGEPVHMKEVIDRALEQAKLLSAGQHVFVENIADDLYIKGIETELASAVSNLLTNAIRYTPKDGTITTSWYLTESGLACYSVQDTGIGIAAQDIPRLTERFYRVDRGRSRATGGTGLGLAITKHVAMRHNAELHIQSRIGAGSIFSLEFPASRVMTPPSP
ncbi:phosphate regulon sensor histidine kinase PhoR [Pusillimonas sp. NJUB218]|uniref:phosphate regulon sensor histidine kinase PhoR n=1 Tax=Pusillimonas sp. NJUB218 TaxID=2023230 RepID=UPI000F4C319D|nr:phosphate regulon sensor histidine kinase PhoR [Pusillimonas sp. NJUB218]ROT44877.1 phosphate regulon sensor histidine kinase PhoR [Pusillimonas sp. NJUB218]